MLYRPLVRTSRAALWSRRLGGIAVPILLVTLIEHRADVIETAHALVLVAVATTLGIAALLSAAFGFHVIWERGFVGARSASLGVVYGLMALAPAIYGGYAAATHPTLSDISTDWVDPPLFREVAFARVGSSNGVDPPPPEKIQLQKAVYPDIVTRRFGIGTEQLFNAAKKVVDRNGWKVLQVLQPKEDGDRGRIEAETHTQLLGAEEDVVIRILADSAGAHLDMRSSSRFGTHDMGQNAERIRSFFAALDTAVAENFGQ
ncbi:MAG: DUF1499 domain-containing protein [Ancalomicrobiaceae bacterium]|nr:DUF1499 domain-containing protein [Ancalomicrobiaceae bacterium]